MIQVVHNNSLFKINPDDVVDLSIPYHFNGDQPNFYNVKKGELTYLKTGETSWSVASGEGCNVPEISMNIHCSGTHTESVGHLLKNTGDIGLILTNPFMPAILITLDTTDFGESNENYHCLVNDNEKVISAKNIFSNYKKFLGTNPDVLIIRTKPNPKTKQYINFSDNPPPFLTNDAMVMICEMGINHLIVDIPSIDRMSDEGILGNHRIFWGDGLSPKTEIDAQSKKTITELAYIPNFVEDGFYFVNIQIPHFVCDAAPSRPLLCKIL